MIWRPCCMKFKKNPIQEIYYRVNFPIFGLRYKRLYCIFSVFFFLTTSKEYRNPLQKVRYGVNIPNFSSALYGDRALWRLTVSSGFFLITVKKCIELIWINHSRIISFFTRSNMSENFPRAGNKPNISQFVDRKELKNWGFFFLIDILHNS